MKHCVVLIVGTRPEAIKMSPVYRALPSVGLDPFIISSGQHRDILAQTMSSLGLAADVDLELMTPGQTLNEICARVFERLPRALLAADARAVLVQGDTTTALAATLVAYHLRIPVGHVEAGLRTFDHDNPWPEEGNRQVIDRMSAWCFAPTEASAANLEREMIPRERIVVTGNTAVDALLWTLRTAAVMPGRESTTDTLVHAAIGGDETASGAFVLLTLHRRESFGQPLRAILAGVRDFLSTTPAARVVWPVHPNPEVQAAFDELFSDSPQMVRLSSLPYREFAKLLFASRFVITDSGGIQEEAPSLGKRVLVARETTERPEGLTAGLNRVIGRSREGIANAMRAAWDEPPYRGALPAPNPYGDGDAGLRIARAVCAGIEALEARSTPR